MYISRRSLLHFGMLAAVLFAVGCAGDSSVAPDDKGNLPPSGGTGTGTLRVVAEVEGYDLGGGDFETEFIATVTDTLDQPASVTVVVSGRFGDVQLAEETPGSYRALRPGYETGSYTLNVAGDAGNVTAVTAVAPDIHVITVPAAGDTVAAGTALNVRWTHAATSAQCRLATLDYDSDWIYGDPGTLWTPSIGNPPRTDQRVSLTRRNVQEPAGALPGSRLAVGIRCAVEPVIAQ